MSFTNKSWNGVTADRTRTSNNKHFHFEAVTAASGSHASGPTDGAELQIECLTDARSQDNHVAERDGKTSTRCVEKISLILHGNL
jgi:hypothetical protein